jgi:cholesterol transport system auxiliary component
MNCPETAVRNYCKYLILLIIFVSSCGGGLVGCMSLLPEKSSAPALFDLGPPRAHAVSNPGIDATMLIAPATASAWLDNSGIQYRLAYQDAGRTEAYAHNRWVSTPAQLFTQHARSRFAAATRGVVSVQDGAKADVALRLELDDFSQTFDGAQSSKATVRVRASLIDMNTRALLAQQNFSVARPAAPNAPAAAQALAAASDALIEELYAWAAQRLKK